MDHVAINAAIPQPTGQPKTIAPGLIRHGNSRDLLPSLDSFVAPAIQKTQQHLRISSNFLQWFAIDPRDHPGNEPGRRTHFNYCYERLILNEGSETRFAIVVVALLHILHKGAPINLRTDRTTSLAVASAVP